MRAWIDLHNTASAAIRRKGRLLEESRALCAVAYANTRVQSCTFKRSGDGTPSGFGRIMVRSFPWRVVKAFV